MLRFFCCGSKDPEKVTSSQQATPKTIHLPEEQLTGEQKHAAYEIIEQRLKRDPQYALNEAKKNFFEMDPCAQATVARTLADAKRINELPVDVAQELTRIKHTMPLQRERANCKVNKY